MSKDGDSLSEQKCVCESVGARESVCERKCASVSVQERESLCLLECESEWVCGCAYVCVRVRTCVSECISGCCDEHKSGLILTVAITCLVRSFIGIIGSKNLQG